MKRKLPINPHPETVRIVRCKIQVLDETSEISSSSANFNQSATLITASSATAYSQLNSTSNSETASEASESSSSESVSTSEDSSEDDSELDDEDEEESEDDSSDNDTTSSSGSEESDNNDITIIPTSLGTTIFTDAQTGITTLRTGQKPIIDHSYRAKPSSIAKRLQNFMPKMLDANNILDDEQKAGILSERVLEMDVDGDDAGQQYIEMNLGLGVLEEQNAGGTIKSDSDGEVDVLGNLFKSPNLKNHKQIIQEINGAPH